MLGPFLIRVFAIIRIFCLSTKVQNMKIPEIPFLSVLGNVHEPSM